MNKYLKKEITGANMDSAKWLHKVRTGLLITLLLIGTLGLLSEKKLPDAKKTVIWKLENPALVGGFKPEILGSPQIVRDNTGIALSFDGIDDGLIVPVNPVAGWKKFTVEVLFKPAADGPTAPRFVHFQDDEGNRGTIETRVTPQGQWYLDTFLRNGKTEKGLTLIDSTHLHPCGQWYWAALVYDGTKMTHYVNGIKELEGQIELGPMRAGQISLGVRLNQVNWFKGLIREIRFHSVALKSKALQR
ncbi:MAG: LamG domain-containing protein [Flavisolibacter sp.]|nr:LamG domain-containing protein [Flavisolibacter sp.]